MKMAQINISDATLASSHQQIAALCWRFRRGQLQVLLVTSRETRRWIVPKGWPMSGCSLHESAEVEAWEEAGAKGAISPDPLGIYNYDKLYPSLPTKHCSVLVYPLRINRLETKFPERNERRRKWFSAKKAAKSVAEPELAELILSAAKTLKNS